MGLLIIIYFKLIASAGAESFQYSEGICTSTQNPSQAISVEKCGFNLNKPDRIEWDVINRECKKIDVFVSKINSRWEFSRLRQQEKHSLKDCGYTRDDASVEFLLENDKGLCHKTIVYTSRFGLHNQRQVVQSSKDLRPCGRQLSQKKNLPAQRRIASQDSSQNKTLTAEFSLPKSQVENNLPSSAEPKSRRKWQPPKANSPPHRPPTRAKTK